MIKLTARIDDDTYHKVMYKLRYGQQTALLQQVMSCLSKVIATQGLAPIVLFISGHGALTLDPTKEDSNDSNGSHKA